MDVCDMSSRERHKHPITVYIWDFVVNVEQRARLAVDVGLSRKLRPRLDGLSAGAETVCWIFLMV